MGSHFEIWDADTLAEKEARVVQAGIPDVVSNYSF
jgi:MraZ protein